MKKNILLTGLPRSGKSTLLHKIVGELTHKVGIAADEILESDERVGFEVETSLGSITTFAHINFQTPHQVSKYSVDIEKLESALSEVVSFKEDDALYVDEIGQMQLLSEKFKRLVQTYLNSTNVCVATISAVYEDDFTKTIKNRDDVVLVEITVSNREEKIREVRELLRGLCV